MNPYSHVIADPYELLLKLDYENSQAKIVGSEIRIKPYFGALYDLSLKVSGPQEDEVMAGDEFLRQNIRRGNSFIQIWQRPDQVVKTFTARKGLRKFFDLSREYLQYNLGIKQALNSSKNTYHDVDFHRIIFNDLKLAMEQGQEVKVYSMVKANGENAQVSYVDELNCWLIASKNVSLLARNRSDISLYQQGRFVNIDRYQFARLMAQAWFDIIEKMDSNTQANLKKDLTNRTIIGEYCGNQECQHLVKYERVTIYWFAVVDNDSLKEECVDVQMSQAFFKYYGLDTTTVTDLGSFTSFHSLNYMLLKYFDEISRSRIEVSHEGAVLYFELQQKGDKPRVISLAKLKTLEYRIYRKLREKLRTYLRDESITMSTMIGRFKKEVQELCRTVRPPKPLYYYTDIANKALDFVRDFPNSTHMIHEHYISFLSVVIYALSNRVQINLSHFESQFINPLLKEPWSDFSSPKKQLIVVVPVGIPGMGKSTFFEAMQNHILNAYSDVNVQILSQDKIRAYLMNYERDRNKTLTNEEVFERTRQEATDKYKKEMDKIVEGFDQQSKFSTFFLLLDKNHPVKDLEKQLSAIKNKAKANLDVLTVTIFPKTVREFVHRDADIHLPFSLNFMITCINRVQNRQKHESLPGNGHQSLGVLTKFISLFSEAKLECFESDLDVFYPYVQENEASDKQYSVVLVDDFAQILKNTKSGSKCSTQLLDDFLEAIQYDQPRQEPLDPEQLSQRAGKIVEEVISKFKINPQPNNKGQKERKKSVSVRFNQSPQIADVPLPLPMFFGIEVQYRDIENIKIWIQKAIVLTNNYPQDVELKGMPSAAQGKQRDTVKRRVSTLNDISNMIDKINPQSLHVTTLYLGNKPSKEMYDHEVCRSFRENQPFTLTLKLLAMIPQGLVTIGLDSNSFQAPIENEYPHITFQFKKPEFQAKDSNALLEQIGRPNYDQTFFEQEVTINRMKYTAQVIVPYPSLKVEGRSKRYEKLNK